MASGLKSWPAIVLLGGAVATALLLPTPGAEEAFESPSDVLPEGERYLQLRDAVQLEREAIQRFLWRDSLTAVLAARAPAEGPAVVIEGTEAIPEGRIVLITNRVLVGVAKLGSVPRVDLGVFLLKVTGSPLDPRWDQRHEEYLVGESNGRPYCIVAQVSSEPRASFPRDFYSGLGACWFPLRYGLPGAHVAQWLGAGSFYRGSRYWNMPGWQASLRIRMPPPLSNAGPWDASVPFSRCLAGDVQLCEQVFLGPLGRETSLGWKLSLAVPEVWAASGLETSTSTGSQATMFADLETEFGRERFSRFWQSDLEVGAAFQEAFGISAGEWTRSWVSAHHPPPRAPLRADAWAGFETLLVVLAAMLVALWRVGRRQVA